MNDRERWQKLDEEQYRVTRCSGTERPFTGRYWDHKGDGVYLCVCCQAPLFDSRHKYDSGSGWPSFWQPAEGADITELSDTRHGMVRTEVRCGHCQAHLGHVFPDGPPPTGLRYCINSASLDFTPRGG
ncbi:MAG TPA: peptide-methionine (R)-S-oxide reductase MsrB [Thiohalobacter sp.]|nr:peptide-methionine (R)-S-oxide reductase MsrB [Thiohalobacter sp.]